MSKISAQDVNKLRGMTGAGMMDCKKALVEAEGDFDKAVEHLRKKGQKISASRQDREAQEGAVFAVLNNDESVGVLLELNCETDFVARNEDFQQLGANLAKKALETGAQTLEDIKKLELDGKPVDTLLTEAMGRIGEKLEVSKFVRLEGEKVVPYIHPGAKIGVLVAFEGAEGVDTATAGKDVAMQIASMNPIALDKDGVDPATVQQEIEIGKEQARQEGKPEQILEKIAMGKLEKFYKERTLLHQEFVKDPSMNITQYLKTHSDKLSIKGFYRMHLG